MLGRCVSISLRLVTVLIFAVALLLGWLSTFDIPEGVFFATLIPLLQFKMPPTIFGHGKMTGVPAVPDDMQPQPRPENELFLHLPKKTNKRDAVDTDNEDGKDNDDEYYKMPQNGLGMCCRPTAYDDEMVRRTVLWYLLQGGRLIDTAHLYLNHAPIGVAIQQAMQRYGVPRSEIFVTTKIWPGTTSTWFGNATTAYHAVELYCRELQLDYIDLVLIHAPSNMFPKYLFPKSSSSTDNCKGMSSKQCRVETWKGLSKARDDGLVRSLGVRSSVHNVNKHMAKRIVGARGNQKNNNQSRYSFSSSI
jgi:diketogulonate reductase-like aldo/keto reductase